MSSRRKRAKVQPKKHIIPFALFLTFGILVGMFAAGSAGVYALMQSWLTDLPAINGIDAYNDVQKTRIYAADGTTVLAEFYEYDREPVTLDKVSPDVVNATVAVEDERFWQHSGVDYYGIIRAVVVDLTSSRTEGASTITQQLVRQTVLQDEATEFSLKRKLREAALAQEVERRYSKQDVLNMYLNTVNYGDGSWGIQSAAKHYFDKDASGLTLAEAALLCGIPQSPEYNNPVTYPENAIKRRNVVLERMYVNNYISEAEMSDAKAEPLNMKVSKRSVDGIYLAPYATSYVRHQLLNDFSQMMVFKGGLNVYTSIDLNYEKWADEACSKREALIPSNFEVSFVCVDPKTGYIKCMRGGKDYYNNQINTCWQMNRNAGSSFKPFALVTAIEKGYSPQTLVSTSSPLNIPLDNGESWRVSNYSGRGMGTMTLARATALSSNTAYARVGRAVGAEAIVDTAYRMGISKDKKLEAVPAIVLGASGVDTLSMASAYSTLANNGVHNRPTAIMKITDSSGNVVYQHNPDNTRVLTPEVAYAATQVLEGVVDYGTGTAANIYGRDIAGKTGTSNDWADAWFIGYTPQICAAVWVGDRNKLTPLGRNEGGVNSAPVWHDFMLKALEDQPVEYFTDEPSPTYDRSLSFMTPEEKAAAAAAAAEAAADNDGDGYSNSSERNSGTDPNDANDYPGKAAQDGNNPSGQTGNGGSGGNSGSSGSGSSGSGGSSGSSGSGGSSGNSGGGGSGGSGGGGSGGGGGSSGSSGSGAGSSGGGSDAVSSGGSDVISPPSD
ncbi:MAG: PBP1A family penicillin-binding protein [Actinomycetia bacterium]|nr:PBP1A family penicillin-binding protein [Actinomycetes bacterium]